jgi:hypothetical protein
LTFCRYLNLGLKGAVTPESQQATGPSYKVSNVEKEGKATLPQSRGRTVRSLASQRHSHGVEQEITEGNTTLRLVPDDRYHAIVGNHRRRRRSQGEIRRVYLRETGVIWPHRLAVRTTAFQAVNRSSILRGVIEVKLVLLHTSC